MSIAKVVRHWRALFGQPKRNRPQAWKRSREFVVLIGGRADGTTLTADRRMRRISIPIAPDFRAWEQWMWPPKRLEIMHETYRRTNRFSGPRRIYEYERK